MKLWYDKLGHQLMVTVLGAKDLPVREDGRPRNPYVQMFLLPDRRYTLLTTTNPTRYTTLTLTIHQETNYYQLASFLTSSS